MKQLFSITTLLFLTLVSLSAAGSDAFHIERRFEKPAKIPTSTLSYLTKEIGPDKLASCQAAKPNDIFEAQSVSLNKSTKALVVKPAQMCICSTHECPMWMFKVKGNAAKPIWRMPATRELEILDKKLNGYRKLKETGAEPTRGHDSIWSWDKDNYTEIDKTVWNLDTEKNCRFTEQTSQLVDGKMVQHSIKCFQD